ncbi:MAG: hypothetical protein RML40_10450 [Bacteroidota bacterium]|nr:hypothetical protein [Candidatus Kapabacteria bacterium]MDW8220933.1 hypothetical protein [Bacteroidota bacterium]
MVNHRWNVRIQHALWVYVLILVSLALLTPLIFYGLDFTDTGYSTTMAWMQAKHPSAALWDFNNFGSAFLAGLWFYTGAESLLAYRVQWVIMITGTALCSFILLSWFYDDKRAIVGALIPTLILAVFNSEEGLIVEYHNLPGFLALASILPFLRWFLSPTDSSRQKLILLLGMSGFVSAFMVLSRLPMILWCIVLYAVIGIAIWYGYKRNEAVHAALWYTAGVFVGALCVLGFIAMRGFTLHSIVADSIKSLQAVNTFHEYAMHHPELGYYPLSISTAIRYGKILSIGLLALVVAIVWGRMHIARSSRGEPIERVLAIICSGLIVAAVLGLSSKSLGFHYGPITSLVLGAPLVILVYIAILHWQKVHMRKKVLFGCAYAFFVLVSLGGSGVWVSNFRHGVWLIFPVALLEMRLYMQQIVGLRFLRLLLVTGAIVLGVSLRIQMPYRDQPLYRLTAQFSSPILAGIFSSPGRTATTEELLGELRRRGVRAGDTLQAYPSMAMLYFATHTVPWYKHPWIGQMWTVRSDLARHAQACVAFPQYVVRAKFDPNAATSLDADRPFHAFQVGYMPEKFFYGEYMYCHDCSTFLDSLFIVQLGYNVVWENKGFALLAKP